MKKYGLFCIAFCAIALCAMAQELPFALQSAQLPIRSISGTFPAYNINETLLDASGNLYITGYFRGSADFDPGSGNVILNSQIPTVYDAFLAKYDAQGALIYVKAITGSGDKRSNTIALTSGGKVLIGGYFFGTADFDPTGSNFSLGSNGGSDVYYVRYDATTGAFEFAASAGGTGNDGVTKIITSPTNDGYVYGYFSKVMDFDLYAGVSELTPVTTQDRFIAKYDPSLNLLWAHGVPTLAINSIGLSSSGFYAVGNFSAPADMDPGAATLTKSPVGSSDVWFSKFDLNGNLLWNNTIGGSDFENAIGLALDASSNLYITGNFTQTVDFDPSAGSTPATSNGLGDAYVAMYNTGGAFQWVRTVGGNRADTGASITLLQNNTLGISGTFNSVSIDADPGAGSRILTNASNDNTSDAFLLLLSTSGTLVDAFHYGAAATGESAGLINSAEGAAFAVVGNYTNPIDFDPSADSVGITNPGVSVQQGYLTRYSLLASLPAAQPTVLVLNNQTGSSIDVSFTGSGADGYLVLRRSGGAVTALPKDGKSYVSGHFLSDAIVAYAGAATSFIDQNLAANTAYHYAVFAYNNTNGAPNYLLPTPLAASTTTSPISYDRTTDSLALVALYNATNGAAWTTQTNWLTGYIDSWHGVTVVANRVTSITLVTNSLVGYLPSSLGNLSSLTQLDLSTNQLTGNIPSEIANLSNLQTLELSTNQLTGHIPPEIGGITSLQTLRLVSNQLSGSIPSVLGSLSNLITLSLSNNPLGGSIPVSLGGLTNLTTLELQNCMLTGSIPAEIGDLTLLTMLDLGSNLVNGRSTNTARNQLTGTIPSELSNLVNLTSINLSSNNLTGTLPAGFTSLTSLTRLWINGNQFTFGAFPTEILSMTNLQFLHLSYCGITGNIPGTISSLTQLSWLLLDFNQIGSIPASLASISPLMMLDVRNNQLTTLPDLSAAPALTTFRVANNNLHFDALEPNISKLGAATNYSPQINVGVADTLNLNITDPFNLTYPIGGSMNTYVWRLNNVVQPAYTTNSVSIASLLPSDAGSWVLSVTNSLVPGLTITSNTVYVNVIAQGMFTWASAGDLTNDGAGADIYSAAWGDYDNDGFEDAMTMGLNVTNRGYLYRNLGNGTFQRRASSLLEFANGRNASWGDYNNDGFLDLFLPDYFTSDSSDAKVAIYKNLGNGTFSAIKLNETGAVGTWSDFDNDGDLDISVTGTFLTESFYRNDGGDVFTKIDVNINYSTAWNPIWVDVNNDGRQDYFLPGEGLDNIRLFINEGANNYYENTIGVSYTGSARGASFADIDNDGDQDIYVMIQTGTAPAAESRFYINDGYGSFFEELGNLRLGEVVRNGRSSAFADLNNDGYQDLITYNQETAPVGLTIFLNNGNGTFSKVTNQTFNFTSVFSAVSTADYDNDGFLDLFYSVALGTPPVPNGLYKNVGNSNHWLKVKLQGSTSNRGGIGSRIAVKADGFWRYQQVLSSNGFGNQSSLLTHVGMGTALTADSIVVHWPSGYRQVLINQAADQTLVISEPTNPVSTTDITVQAAYALQSQNAESFSALFDYMLDANDNMVVVGAFYGTVDFNPGPGTNLITSTSVDEEGYVASFGQDGTLRWMRSFPYSGSENNVNHESIASDASGQVLIGGQVRGTYDVDPGAGVTNLTSNVAMQNDPYFARYDANGNFLWAKQLLSTTNSNDPDLEMMVIDTGGNIIIAGDFADGTIDMDPGAGTANIVSSDTYEDIFFGKYNASGDYQWAFKVGTNGYYDFSPQLTTDSQNNIYLSYTIDDIVGRQVVSKYDPSGALLWSFENLNAYGAELRTLKIDEANNRLYLMGSYENTPTFNGTSGSGSLPPAGANADVGYVAVYDLNGAFVSVYGFNSSDESFPLSVNTLNDGSLIISGAYSGTVDLDPSAGVYESYYPESAFLVKLSPAGAFVWAASIPYSDGMVSSINSQGELVSLVVFEGGPIDVDPSTGVVNLSSPTTEGDFALVVYNVQSIVVDPSDRTALEALYTATNGTAWTNNTNWLTADVSTWYGVKVVGTRVTDVVLPSNNLVGTLPAEIGDLTLLDSLNLTGNQLSGTLPDAFAPLTALRYIDLANNSISGSLPTSLLQLSGLRTLGLARNQLSGSIPSTISSLTSLQNLWLDENQLSGDIPTELGNLTTLTNLFIQKNDFTGVVPGSLANLTNLVGCGLDDNSFTSLPNLSTLTNLTYCNVSGNQFSFESLEPNVGIPGIIYAPQDSVGLADTVLIPTNQAYALAYTVGGSANTYVWKKNEVTLAGVTTNTFSLSTPTFNDEGLYRLEVTSALVPSLTLFTRPVLVKVSSLERDSLALAKLFEATNGASWTNKTNWTTTPIATGNWFGVTITANRVTQVLLPGNNLQGPVPAEFADLEGVTNINLSNNFITSLPDFTTYPAIVSLNVANNKLDFASLENNRTLTGIDFSNQKNPVIANDTVLVASGEDYILKTSIGGNANTYQWKRFGATVNGAIADSLVIDNIGRSNMGRYVLEVKNTLVPSLTLVSEPVDILATANLSGIVSVSNNPATAGIVRLLRVTSSNGYDTVRTQTINSTGAYAFNQVVLDDYQIVGFADTLVAGQERALPTYYESTIYWEEADTLFVQNSLSNLNIVSLLKPSEPLTGTGEIAGIVQEDDGTGSRTEKTRRVGGAGVSARRAQGAGRGNELGELVAYVFTDDEGYFSMPGLPPGVYRINIQYPGYPMDPNSFIDIPIGTTALDERVSVEALVAEGKITVRQLVITHLEGDYVANAYPNPTSGHLTISFEKVAKERTLTLLDTKGRNIAQKEANEKVTSMDMNSLEPGLYLIKVIDGGQKVKTIRISVH